MAFDEWELTSGLADKYRGTVKDAFFGYDSEYQNGEACILRLEILTDNEELQENTDNPLYPVGKGWEPKGKGGSEVAHESGKPKNYNKQSGIGLLIQAALDCGAPIKERGNPFSAEIWKGLEFDWERKEFSGKFSGSTEPTKWARMLPVKYLGDGKSPSATATTTANVPTVAEGEGTMAALPAKWKAKLVNLAKGCTDHDDFIEKAYAMDGVDGEVVVEAAVADDGAGSVWASVHGTE